jgi:hypothetical protein
LVRSVIIASPDEQTEHSSVAISPDSLIKPIVIVGAPRSGTTQLTRIFERHPQLVLAQEPRLIWRYGNDQKSDVLRRVDARPEVIEHVRRYFGRLVPPDRGLRLLEKTPSNTLRLEFVHAVFPDCRIIHIIRDGSRSVYSIRRFWQERTQGVSRGKVRKGLLLQRMREVKLRQLPHYAGEVFRRLLPRSLQRYTGTPAWGPRIPGIACMQRELDPLDIACLQWRMCVELACQQGRRLPKENYFECRLENLSADLIHQMCAFCELEAHPSMFEVEGVGFDVARSRKNQRTQEEIDRVRDWLEPTLQWLGYGENDHRSGAAGIEPHGR